MEKRKCTGCNHQYNSNDAEMVTNKDGWTDECCPNCLNNEYTK